MLENGTISPDLNEPQDCSEIFTILLAYLPKEFALLFECSFTVSLSYSTVMLSTIQEKLYFIPLALPYEALPTSLQETYIRNCESSVDFVLENKQKIVAQQKRKLHSFPPYLAFRITRELANEKKNTVSVSLHLTSNFGHKYFLHSFICHSSVVTNQGHYYCYAQNGGNWYLFNDEKVLYVSPEELQEVCTASVEIEFVLYQKHHASDAIIGTLNMTDLNRKQRMYVIAFYILQLKRVCKK